MRKLRNWLRNEHALSPIFATVLLASIILTFGSIAFYYSSNLTRTTTNNYSGQISNSQQAIGERIGFENVVYDSSSSAKLIVSIINSGSANNVQINTVFLYDSAHNIVGAYSISGGSISALNPITSAGSTTTSLTSLNVGKEAYFTLTLGKATSGNDISLSSGSVYTIHLITKSGSTFDYEFTP